MSTGTGLRPGTDPGAGPLWLRLSPGTPSPVLHDLERAGYVQCETCVVTSKMRKYYRTTPRGEHTLEDVRQTMHAVVTEALRGEGRRRWATW